MTTIYPTFRVYFSVLLITPLGRLRRRSRRRDKKISNLVQGTTGIILKSHQYGKKTAPYYKTGNGTRDDFIRVLRAAEVSITF